LVVTLVTGCGGNQPVQLKTWFLKASFSYIS
jgi:hypothetical protein